MLLSNMRFLMLIGYIINLYNLSNFLVPVTVQTTRRPRTTPNPDRAAALEAASKRVSLQPLHPLI